MKPRLLRDEAKMLAEQSLGYLGVMSDFVTYDKSISDVILNQLGNTIVADHSRSCDRNRKVYLSSLSCCHP